MHYLAVSFEYIYILITLSHLGWVVTTTLATFVESTVALKIGHLRLNTQRAGAAGEMRVVSSPNLRLSDFVENES